MPDEMKFNSETDLIRACLDNNRLAQAELFRRYGSLLLGIAWRYTGCRDQADDVLQESFIRIFRNLEKFRFTGSFEGWLRKITVRTSIDHIKHNGKLVFEELDPRTPPESATFNTYPEEMDCEYIMHEIALLPEGYRTVLNLCAIEGYSYPETAAILGVREVTVRTQFLRAKQRLHEALIKYSINYDPKTV